jgi:hypothetical protein
MTKHLSRKLKSIPASMLYRIHWFDWWQSRVRSQLLRRFVNLPEMPPSSFSPLDILKRGFHHLPAYSVKIDKAIS